MPKQPLGDREVLRYRKRPRIVHAMLASSFLILLFTGLIILWPALAGLAPGGFTRWLHRVAAVIFMAVPFVYWFADRDGAKELMFDSFRYDRDDWRWLKRFWSYAFGHTANMPKQGRLNAGQKLHHASVMLLSASIVASGLVMWFFMPSLGSTGQAWAAVIHDLSMLALTLLLVGHLYFTYVYKALSGMTSGYVDIDDARLEHAKWVEELEEQAQLAEGSTEAAATPQVAVDKDAPVAAEAETTETV